MVEKLDRPAILILPPILVGGVLFIGVLMHYWVWTITPFPIVPARILGALLFIGGGVLAHVAHNAMTRAGTNIFPTQPALALVRDGPFRRTRPCRSVARSRLALLRPRSFQDSVLPATCEPCRATAVELERDDKVRSLRSERAVALVEQSSSFILVRAVGLEKSILLENPKHILPSHGERHGVGPHE